MTEISFIYATDASILALALLALMLACIFVGRKFGLRRFKVNSEKKSGATGTIISAMFGLLAFLLAFTFGMSGNRYDTRRQNIVDEANAIGTAILRSDLYAEDDRLAFRKDFKQYLEARIEFYETATDVEEVTKAMTTADGFGKQLWSRAAQLSRIPENLVASQQMVPALNAMLDMSTTRLIGELARVPDSIVYMLFFISLVSAFYLGYSSAHKGSLDWFVAIGFCLLTSLVVYITLDLDRPRRGFIQLSDSQKAMVELRNLFKE